VEEKHERIEAALKEMPAARAAKPKGKKDQARVSTTDPEARVMKMANGGFNPAYNFQFGVDVTQRVIVGVEVTNIGSDMSQGEPMMDQVEKRCQGLPDDWLMDGGFASHATIEAGTQRGMRVLAPVQASKDTHRDPYQPRPGDSEAVGAWRVRMGTEEAKEAYKLRGQTVELTNAHSRRHGLQQLRVRGSKKVYCVALWVAVAHDLLIWMRYLRTQAAKETRAA
jgi:hypothetical protein